MIFEFRILGLFLMFFLLVFYFVRDNNGNKGNIKYIMDEFDRILGSGSFITFTDLLDDLDEEDNGKRNNRKINKIRNKIKNIIIRYNSETQNIYKK